MCKFLHSSFILLYSAFFCVSARSESGQVCVFVRQYLFVYPCCVRWMDVLMIVFLWRKGETETERTVAGRLPSLGGWWEDEGASRKDILSGLVRVWPVLGYMSLVGRLTHRRAFLTLSHITLPLRSPFISHQWPDRGRNWETYTQASSSQLQRRDEQGQRLHSCWTFYCFAAFSVVMVWDYSKDYASFRFFCEFKKKKIFLELMVN